MKPPKSNKKRRFNILVGTTRKNAKKVGTGYWRGTTAVFDQLVIVNDEHIFIDPPLSQLFDFRMKGYFHG